MPNQEKGYIITYGWSCVYMGIGPSRTPLFECLMNVNCKHARVYLDIKNAMKILDWLKSWDATNGWRMNDIWNTYRPCEFVIREYKLRGGEDNIYEEEGC